MENSNNISKREQLLKFVPDDTLLFADGFDDAIMGLDTNSLRVVYSKQKKVRQLAKSVQLATCGIQKKIVLPTDEKTPRRNVKNPTGKTDFFSTLRPALGCFSELDTWSHFSVTPYNVVW